MDNGMTLSDIAAVTRDNDDWGGNGLCGLSFSSSSCLATVDSGAAIMDQLSNQ